MQDLLKHVRIYSPLEQIEISMYIYFHWFTLKGWNYITNICSELKSVHFVTECLQNTIACYLIKQRSLQIKTWSVTDLSSECVKVLMSHSHSTISLLLKVKCLSDCLKLLKETITHGLTQSLRVDTRSVFGPPKTLNRVWPCNWNSCKWTITMRRDDDELTQVWGFILSLSDL